ncbi:MAG: hypothetical protein LBU65_09050 [Planctomycetaceae bacterium]|nr:hypothetical protein [Planctomycetaceae bacterium]
MTTTRIARFTYGFAWFTCWLARFASSDRFARIATIRRAMCLNAGNQILQRTGSAANVAANWLARLNWLAGLTCRLTGFTCCWFARRTATTVENAQASKKGGIGVSGRHCENNSRDRKGKQHTTFHWKFSSGNGGIEM